MPRKLKTLPPRRGSGDNANAFAGAFRLWHLRARRPDRTSGGEWTADGKARVFRSGCQVSVTRWSSPSQASP